MDDLVKRLRSLSDCDARSGEPLGRAMREAADRIEALEAQVRAADALAEEMTRLMRRTPFVPAPNGITLTITLDQIADQKAALFAYRAAREADT